MRRRQVIGLLGGAAAWPVAARSQQAAKPVIGFLGPGSQDEAAAIVAMLRQGLTDVGLLEGYNMTIEFRWAQGQMDRLPALAAELANRPVTVLFAVGGAAALAAKAATATIPIVFAISGDPVALGLVASVARSGGNATGVSAAVSGLDAKRVGLLRQLVPNARDLAMLINPGEPASKAQSQEAAAAARGLGLQLQVLNASNDSDLAAAFTNLASLRPGGLLVPSDAFFNARYPQLVELAARHSLPAIYPWREYAHAGGLMSYGANLRNGLRVAGIYLSQILRGAKPAELPVELPAKFELVINVKTAKVLGITVPQALLVAATEVIR
jgi:putative tryptophan/tyrosine transport system substrate-binding protein